MPVDIVPFGAIADKNSNIQWPPSGEVEMDVAGFDEAHKSAIPVLIQQEPLIQIPVASPQGLALLKIIAWDDRDRDLRAKDAIDLAYLLESYQSVEQVVDRLYETDGLMERYDWDVDQGNVHCPSPMSPPARKLSSPIKWILNHDRVAPSRFISLKVLPSC